MWLTISALVFLLAAGWFFLAAIHSAWLSATPVPDPEPYRREAMLQQNIAIALFAASAGCWVAAWWRRRKSQGP